MSVAVFVDAGYLFAQGSTALTGSKVSRTQLNLNETAAIAELTAVAQAKSGNKDLLRVYWYDGALGSRGLTLEHATLANTDHVKLRLGFMNSHGQQKGVDSLIVTDLIELARNRAIGDALLLSGDEDVRIGVQIAQSFGVRVHLLGIAPSRGSQSLQLLYEADTKTEWDNHTVGKFLSLKAPSALVAVATAPAVASAVSSPGSERAALEQVAKVLFASLDSTAIASLHAFWQKQPGLPPEIDGKLLARCRSDIGRDLTPEERRHARKTFAGLVTPKA